MCVFFFFFFFFFFFVWFFFFFFFLFFVLFCFVFIIFYLQSNFNSSNTDGSFNMANSSSFLSPYEFLPIVQENKYLLIVFYFIIKLYVVCTH